PGLTDDRHDFRLARLETQGFVSLDGLSAAPPRKGSGRYFVIFTQARDRQNGRPDRSAAIAPRHLWLLIPANLADPQAAAPPAPIAINQGHRHRCGIAAAGNKIAAAQPEETAWRKLMGR